MQRLILFAIVLLAICVAPAALMAQQYNPTIVKVIDVTVPVTPLPNPTGAIVVAIDGLGSLTPQVQLQCPNPQQWCGFYGLNSLVSLTPAFPPVVLGCGSLGNAAQIAQALAAGITANSLTVNAGYTANASGARVTIQGPGTFQNVVHSYDYHVVFFNSEIHQQYGLPVEPGLPVRNLCDGILGNESHLNPSTGLGLEFTMVTIPDALVANFESVSGAVVPPNWVWSGGGRVSLETVPAFGFPASGSVFMRLSTQDPTGRSLEIKTRFNFDAALPFLRLTYRWFNGENGQNANSNDRFEAYIGEGKGWLFTSEDTFTPLSAGVRTAEVDIHELSSWIQQGDPVDLVFTLQNGGYNTMNDSVVFIDAIQFFPAQPGEGNNPPVGIGSFSFKIDTTTWDLIHGNSGYGAADKKVMPGGIVTVNTWFSQQLQSGSGRPFLIMGSWGTYGSTALAGLPGEFNIIGLNFASAFLIYSGTWGQGFPGIPVFIPPSVPADGLYIQAAITDSTSLNGILISNRIRHRVE